MASAHLAFGHADIALTEIVMSASRPLATMVPKKIDSVFLATIAQVANLLAAYPKPFVVNQLNRRLGLPAAIGAHPQDVLVTGVAWIDLPVNR
jgi:hypothetical protein